MRRRFSLPSGIRTAIVDTGPLYAAADSNDRDHEAARVVLARRDLHLVIPTLVVGEVAFLAASRSGPRAEAALLRNLRDSDVEAPTPADYERMAELIEQYADFPLGAVDASVIALAERFDTDVVVTLDHRHFGAVRPRHRDALTLLPR